MSSVVELRTFMAIVETGSLVQAAKRLNVTQSTVTARLKSLEAAFDTRLMIRSKSGVQLTEAGVQMRRYAVAMLNLWRQAGDEVGSPSRLGRTLSIAISARLAEGVGRTLLGQLLDQNPGGKLAHRVLAEAELGPWLASGQGDGVLSLQPINGDGIESQSYVSQQLVLVADRQDRLVDADPDYIFVDYGEQFGLAHALAYTHAGTARLRTDSPIEAVRRIALAGGSAYVPQQLAIDHKRDHSLAYLLGAPQFTLPTFLSSRVGSGLMDKIKATRPDAPDSSIQA